MFCNNTYEIFRNFEQVELLENLQPNHLHYQVVHTCILAASLLTFFENQWIEYFVFMFCFFLFFFLITAKGFVDWIMKKNFKNSLL